MNIVNPTPTPTPNPSSLPPSSTSSTHTGTTTTTTATTHQASDSYVTLTALRAHTLLVGIIYFTYAGESENAGLRLKALHAILDEGVLTGGGKDAKGKGKEKAGENSEEGKEREEEEDGKVWGMYKIHLSSPSSTTSSSTSDPHHQPLIIQLTHPRILLVFSYLVSAIAKRDPVGRKPRKKVFASEGLVVWQREWREWVSCDDPPAAATASAGAGTRGGGKQGLSCELSSLCQCDPMVLING